jgi:uncharacterized membrane-anchored protein
MVNPHTSERFAPVILGLTIMVVGPALLTDPVIATLTATPLRQAGTAVLSGVLLAAFSVWAVPRVSVQGSTAAEGGDE